MSHILEKPHQDAMRILGFEHLGSCALYLLVVLDEVFLVVMNVDFSLPAKLNIEMNNRQHQGNRRGSNNNEDHKFHCRREVLCKQEQQQRIKTPSKIPARNTKDYRTNGDSKRRHHYKPCWTPGLESGLMQASWIMPSSTVRLDELVSRTITCGEATHP